MPAPLRSEITPDALAIAVGFPCDGDPKWQPGQFEDYEKIAGRGNVKGVTPDDVADDECS